jgi:hypothetical protein
VLQVVLAAVTLAGGASLLPAAAGATPVVSVYMSPTGSDTNDGSSPTSPVLTLARAQEVLIADAPDTDAQVLIAPGTYVEASTYWWYHIPGHSITFKPTSGRPVFHGTEGNAGFWVAVRLKADDPGGDTNLRFIGITVEHYMGGGIVFDGHVITNDDGLRVPATAGANHNLVQDMVFSDTGSSYVDTPGKYGFGDIDTSNSSNNIITNNVFTHAENAAPNNGLMHAIYFADYSQHNTVAGNMFSYISSDPFRVRNASDDNDFYGNILYQAGALAYTSDWFCDTDCQASDPTHPRECASQNVHVYDNVGFSGYAGDPIPWVNLIPAGSDYPGGTGCGDPAPRIIASDNFSLTLPSLS